MKFGNLFAGSALIKRTLAVCIALVLLGSLFASAYAAELTEEIQPPEEEPAAAVLTYVFLVNGAQYRGVTVGSGETLTRPDDPVLDGHSFAGWFTADGMEVTGFGTVAAFEASATVELYGRFVAAEVPAVSEDPPAPQSPAIGEDNEEEPEDKQPAEAPQSLSAAAGQYGFTAQGALPERTAWLSVIALEDGQESLRAAVGSLLGEDIGESYTVYAFDITLIDEDGNSLQPTDGMVSISVSGLELGDTVRVVHVHGAVGAPMRLRATAVSAAEELSAQTDGGVLTFSTVSFSTFYVFSGKTELSPDDWYHTALVDMEQGTSGGKTIYDTHFGKLRELSKGETVIFTDMEGIVSTYCVEKLETLNPDAVDTVLNSGYDLVLYTCTKGGRTRVIVFCDRAAETASSSAPRQTEK